MNIYPAIDIQDGRCVRLEQGRFDAVTTYSDDPLAMAEQWRALGAQWLHVVNLDGARTGLMEGRTPDAVRRIVEQVGLPVQLGGGMRHPDMVKRMLDLGVARVVVGTAVAGDPAIARTLLEPFGERVAVGVDARDGLVAVQGWQEHVGEQAVAYVARLAELGARRFIFTDIARDGMLQGINLASLAQVAAAVPHLPVIASGGVASLADIDALHDLKARTVPNIDGVIIGKALYAGAVTLPEVLARAVSAL